MKDYECADPACACHQRAWLEEMEEMEQQVFPDARPRSEVFVCIVDESAGLRGEEHVVDLQAAAARLQEIADAIDAVDLTQETEQIKAALASIKDELVTLVDELKGDAEDV